MRSNFWKGRQRLNRLYRWIANVVRPKIDKVILFQSSVPNNPEVRDFLVTAEGVRSPCGLRRFLSGVKSLQVQGLSAAELAALRCATLSAATGSAARTFILVAENQPAFFQIIG